MAQTKKTTEVKKTIAKKSNAKSTNKADTKKVPAKASTSKSKGGVKRSATKNTKRKVTAKKEGSIPANAAVRTLATDKGTLTISDNLGKVTVTPNLMQEIVKEEKSYAEDVLAVIAPIACLVGGVLGGVAVWEWTELNDWFGALPVLAGIGGAFYFYKKG